MEKRKEWLDVPIKCDQCGHTNVHYTDNSVLYGNTFGKWSKIWYCPSCKAAVSCHPNTHYPMGKMADSATRKARSRAHKYFDQIFRKYRLMSRSSAYVWLAREMGIKTKNCHISYFNAEQCELVVKLSKAKIKKGRTKSKTVTHVNGRKVSRKGHRRKF